MHVRNDSAFHDIEWLHNTILSQDYYYSEMDLSSSDSELLQQSHFLPPGMDIQQLLGDKKYEKLRRIILKSFGVDMNQLIHFYPMIAIHILLESSFHNSSSLILDQALYEYAKSRNKEMKYLETKEEQMGLFRNIPVEIQLKQLVQLGRNPSKVKKKYADLCRHYSEKNTRLLYRNSLHQMGILRKPLLYNRNIKMADLLAENLLGEKAFIAVGAAHLFGKYGILRLLKHRDFSIKVAQPSLQAY
ncbi:hypothetical protein GCM10025777_27930 [Membranihabitans marinus]